MIVFSSRKCRSRVAKLAYLGSSARSGRLMASAKRRNSRSLLTPMATWPSYAANSPYPAVPNSLSSIPSGFNCCPVIPVELSTSRLSTIEMVR